MLRDCCISWVSLLIFLTLRLDVEFCCFLCTFIKCLYMSETVPLAYLFNVVLFIYTKRGMTTTMKAKMKER